MAFKRSAVRSRLSPPKRNDTRLCVVSFIRNAQRTADLLHFNKRSMTNAAKPSHLSAVRSRLSPPRKNDTRLCVVSFIRNAQRTADLLPFKRTPRSQINGYGCKAYFCRKKVNAIERANWNLSLSFNFSTSKQRTFFTGFSCWYKPCFVQDFLGGNITCPPRRSR